MVLDTFLIGIPGDVRQEDILVRLWEIEEGGVLSAPVAFCFEVNGFSPFGLANLSEILFGSPDSEMLRVHPILGTALPSEPKLVPAPPMIVRAARDGKSIEPILELERQLKAVSDGLVKSGGLSTVTALSLLTDLRWPAKIRMLEHHPLRLALAVAVKGSANEEEVSALFSIPLAATTLLEPDIEFPEPDCTWDRWIAWRLPTNLIAALAEMSDDRGLEVLSRWRAARFRTVHRGVGDLTIQRELTDVLNALRMASRRAVNERVTLLIGWSTEA